MEERLQKYMARCGVDSRRKCEELIAAGRVSVNEETVREPGVKIDPSRDRVKVDHKLLRLEKHAYYLHYKVKGVATTVSDDLGRKTVMDCIPPLPERIYPVGRLDMESEGLLVLTNDGELANYLTHPAHGVVKTYRVVTEGRIPQETLETLAEKGIRLGPVLVKPTRVEFDRYDNDNTILHISVAEGINREVRRIFAALGHEVKKLLRTHLGPLSLAGVKRGGLRLLSPKEVESLRKGMAGVEPEEEGKMFPPGSAKGRRPTGPRGRPNRGGTPAGRARGQRHDQTLRQGKPPRQGKPDPAVGARNPEGRGKVIVDDWEKPKRTLRPKRGKDVPPPATDRERNRGKAAGTDRAVGRDKAAGRDKTVGRDKAVGRGREEAGFDRKSASPKYAKTRDGNTRDVKTRDVNRRDAKTRDMNTREARARDAKPVSAQAKAPQATPSAHKQGRSRPASARPIGHPLLRRAEAKAKGKRP